MLSVKGHYRDGKITLLEPMPEGVSEADLKIIVMPKEERRYLPPSGEALSVKEARGVQQFQALGLQAFFDTSDDAKVDWEDCLGLK